MLRIFLICILFLHGAAEAVCLNPFGCKPSTFEECRTEAAKMPTETGVRLAASSCMQQFFYGPKEEKRKQEELRLSIQWAKLISATTVVTLDRALSVLGKQVASGNPHTCLDDRKNPTKASCQWHEWNSSKEEESCVSAGLLPSLATNKPFVYRAEFVVDTGQLYRWYGEPLSSCNDPIK